MRWAPTLRRTANAVRWMADFLFLVVVVTSPREGDTVRGGVRCELRVGTVETAVHITWVFT